VVTKNFGGKYFYDDTKLVLPTREYFPSKVQSEDEAVAETFAAVKKYAGMDAWSCKLENKSQIFNRESQQR
jgi:hypothetical protein